MTSGLPSDEVAEDYKNSLEDLTLNSRYEISNLTVIAKENMDHALAISRVIENHIRNAPPSRKLPALYVLDSVVKNVGTPYTLFFGRNLYQTFMNAYTLVDGPIRKKLEEMLKTWKEPVPGSLDTRPVFPTEVTRNIENALIKARTAAVQLQQQQAKTLHGRATGNWLSTPTPPPVTPVPRMNGTASASYPGYSQQHGYLHRQTPATLSPVEPSNGFGVPPGGLQAVQYPAQFTSPAPSAQFNLADGYAQPAGGLEALNHDLSNLISVARAEFASNPYDQGLQQRLKALLDLQTILQSQQLPSDQVRLIREQVAQLSPGSQPGLPVAPPPIYPLPQVAPVHEQRPQLQASVQSLLPPNALAALLASATASQAQTPPAPQPTVPVSQPYTFFSQPPPNPTPAAIAPQPVGGSSLLASLRAAGILAPVTDNSSVAPSIPATPIKSLQPTSLKLDRSKPVVGRQIRRPMVEIPKDLQMSSASLKTPRPHLISQLYELQPNQCSTCGRRFLATNEGKQKKARHLDWHFKVNIRMADAAKRGQNRSWYVDEMEWIKSQDDDEENKEEVATSLSLTSIDNGTSILQKERSKQQWVPVPNDPAMANTTCPICQERFETVWHDDAQEWVWMDAIKIGGRVYHASCHAEASRDGGKNGTLSRNLTPDPLVLGKRKAEDGEPFPMRGKVKKELAT